MLTLLLPRLVSVAITAVAMHAADPARPVGLLAIHGTFGQDPTPEQFGAMVLEARARQFRAVVLVVDAEGYPDPKSPFQKRIDVLYKSEDFAEPIASLVQPPATPRPRLIAWVKNAKGGAALLPLMTPEVYFHPAGRLGEMGNCLASILDERGRTGEFYSLTLRNGHAQGALIAAGHDPRLVMAVMGGGYALSFRIVDGAVQYSERRAEPGTAEVTLSGETPMTLDAKLAVTLGVSRGTAATLEELLAAAGLAGRPVVELQAPPAAHADHGGR